MNLKDVPVPEIYKSSADFRFFLEWFNNCLTRTKYDIENTYDLYDPLRCPEWLLWMLGETMGFKYDDRLPASFNRLVLVYFMSMIRNKGSKDGVTLAAEVNLAQFNLLEIGAENPDIMYNRLEDTSIPVNSVYVTPHTAEGYIEVVYFSTEVPIDACIEYVRPLGMYLFAHAGVRFDARTKIWVDARLTNTNDMRVSIGPTHVGHYNRNDYARMQKMYNEEEHEINTEDTRNPVYYRNSVAEQGEENDINPGYRALYSLQMSNNENVFRSLISPIFDLGYGPQDVDVYYPDDYDTPPYKDAPAYNLRYNKAREEKLGDEVYTIDNDRTESVIKPRPAVNPIYAKVGDAISLNDENTKYTKVDKNGNIIYVDSDDA